MSNLKVKVRSRTAHVNKHNIQCSIHLWPERVAWLHSMLSLNSPAEGKEMTQKFVNCNNIVLNKEN